MAEELSKTYNPEEHEGRIYEWWEREGYFKPEKLVELGTANRDGARFCITMPPPNVTGILILGARHLWPGRGSGRPSRMRESPTNTASWVSRATGSASGSRWTRRSTAR